MAAAEAAADVVAAAVPEGLHIKPIRLQQLQPCQSRLVPVVPVEPETLVAKERMEATPFL